MANKVDHNAVVAKNNNLVGELAKFELSELRLIAFCLAHLDSRQPENPEITARVNDLTTIFPSMDEKSSYAVVRRALLNINKKPFEYTEENGDCTFLNWFEGFTYRNKKGEISFFVAERMRPFLLGLKNNFTQYRLADVYQFKSATTWKLYENLAQWRRKKSWNVELEELRARLGITGKYSSWSILNRDVIKPSVDDINQFSDLTIEYHKEKSGRQVVGIVFNIETTSSDDSVIEVETPERELQRHLLDIGINAKTAAEYALKINRQGVADRILARLPGMVERAKLRGVNVPKYVIGSIQGELRQKSLFEFSSPVSSSPDEEVTTEPEHKAALECWVHHKNQLKQQCPIRSNGETPSEEKCRICLKTIKIDVFGV